MENLRYKMSEKQIITALECLSKPNSSPADREKCYFMWKEPSCFSCYHEVAQNALALIKSQEQKIFELENRLKECENGYEGTLALERAKIKELTEESKKWEQAYDCASSACLEFSSKCDELTEENERLNQSCTNLEQECKKWQDRIKIECEYTERITVRKMQEEIKERCIKGGIYPAFVKRTIDQIAKEMLEGEK